MALRSIASTFLPLALRTNTYYDFDFVSPVEVFVHEQFSLPIVSPAIAWCAADCYRRQPKEFAFCVADRRAETRRSVSGHYVNASLNGAQMDVRSSCREESKLKRLRLIQIGSRSNGNCFAALHGPPRPAD